MQTFIYKHLCEDMLFFLDKYLEIEFLCHILSVYLIIYKKKTAKMFFSVAELFGISNNIWKGPLFYTLKTLSMVRFINFSHSSKCIVVSNYNFNFHIPEDTENIFMNLFNTYVYSLVKNHSNFLPMFYLGFVFSYYWVIISLI